MDKDKGGTLNVEGNCALKLFEANAQNDHVAEIKQLMDMLGMKVRPFQPWLSLCLTHPLGRGREREGEG